jgi:O-antigen/teichoic acid export membrane protein
MSRSRIPLSMTETIHDGEPPTGGRREQNLIANYGVLVGSFLLGQILGLVGLTLVSHRVGPSGLGDYGYALNLATYFGLPLMPGFALLGIRRLATSEPDDHSRIVGELQILSLANAFLALLVLGIGASLLTPDKHSAALLPILGLTLVLNAVADEWALQGLQRVRAIGLYRLLGQVVYLGALLIILFSGRLTIFGYAWSNFIGLAATAVLEVITVWRVVGRPALRGPRRVFAERRAASKIVRRTLPLAASSVMLQVYYYSDVVILGQLKPAAAVGLYTTAGRLPLAMLTMSTLWGTVFFPHAAQLWGSDRARLIKQTRHFATLAALVAIPAVPIAASIAPDALGSLFGTSFRAGGTTFVLLVAFAAISLVNVNVSNLLLATGRDRSYVLLVTTAAFVNIALNFFLIPKWGPAGAAAASVIAEVASLGVGALRVSQITGVRFLPFNRRIVSGIPPLAVSCVGLVVASGLQWELRAVIGASAYFAVAVATKSLDVSDFRTPTYTSAN